MRLAILTASVIFVALEFALGAEPTTDSPKVAAEELINQIVTDSRPTEFMIMGGGFMGIPGDFGYNYSQQVFQWDRIGKNKSRLTAQSEELIKRGGDVVPLIHKAVKEIDPNKSAATQLTLILAKVGSRESVPVLIDLFDRSTAREEGAAIGLGLSRQSNAFGCTSALWQLTDRQHAYSPKEWKAWWVAVQREFVPAHERNKHMVMSDQVRGLINELKDDKKQTRERLVVMGPGTLPHLSNALKTADAKQKLRLAWVIDELNSADKLPTELRHEYYVDRFSKLHSGGKNTISLPINHTACLRALEQNNLKDFFRAVVETDRKVIDAGRPAAMSGWVSHNSRLFRQKFDNLWHHEKRYPVDGLIPYKDPAAEVDSIVEMIIAEFKSENLGARNAAAEFADMIGLSTKRHPEPLIRALRDAWLAEKNEEMRVDYAITLSRFQTPFVREEFTKQIWSKDLGILGDAAAMIDWNGIGPDTKYPKVFDRLVELTSHQNNRVRRCAVVSLANEASHRLLPHLERLIEEDQDRILESCLSAIKKHPDEKHGPLLIKLAGRGIHGTRYGAIDTLSLPIYAKHVSGLAKYLTDEKFGGYAVNALVKSQEQDSLPRLMSELKNGNDINGMVYQHLKKLTGESFDNASQPWIDWWKKQQD